MTTETPSEQQPSAGSAAPALPAKFRAVPCANCGGPMRYNIGRDATWEDSKADRFSDRDPDREFEFLSLQSSPQLRCTNCGHADLIPAAEGQVTDRTFPGEDTAHASPPHSEESRCPVCAGAALSETRAKGGQKVATECSSCGGSLIRADLPGAEWWKVDGVLPLLVDEETARRRVLEQCSAVRASRKNRALYRQAELTLHYFPVLKVSADTVVRYEGRVGRTRGTGTDRRTEWRDVAGTLERAAEVSFFTDPAVEEAIPKGQASRVPLPLPKKFRRVNTFQPIYNPGAAVPFRREYLAGHEAYLPQGTFDVYRRMAEERMHHQLREAVGREIGGDVHQFPSFDVQASNWQYRLVLAPVYLAAVEVRGQNREIWVDGATGVAIVETPGSLLGVLYALVLLALIAAGAMVAAGLVLGLLVLLTLPFQ